MNYMDDCNVGDYVLTRVGVTQILEIRNDWDNVTLWCSSTYKEKNVNKFQEWNEDGILWNSSGGANNVLKIINKEANPEYFL